MQEAQRRWGSADIITGSKKKKTERDRGSPQYQSDAIDKAEAKRQRKAERNKRNAC